MNKYVNYILLSVLAQLPSEWQKTSQRVLAIALRCTEASLFGMYKGFVSWILVVIMRQTSPYFHTAIKGKHSHMAKRRTFFPLIIDPLNLPGPEVIKLFPCSTQLSTKI